MAWAHGDGWPGSHWGWVSQGPGSRKRSGGQGFCLGLSQPSWEAANCSPNIPWLQLCSNQLPFARKPVSLSYSPSKPTLQGSLIPFSLRNLHLVYQTNLGSSTSEQSWHFLLIFYWCFPFLAMFHSQSAWTCLNICITSIKVHRIRYNAIFSLWFYEFY